MSGESGSVSLGAMVALMSRADWAEFHRLSRLVAAGDTPTCVLGRRAHDVFLRRYPNVRRVVVAERAHGVTEIS